jgi:hypothetical protein
LLWVEELTVDGVVGFHEVCVGGVGCGILDGGERELK